MYFNWKYSLCLKHIHLLATLLGIPCYYPFGLLLTFRTTFIFCGTAQCWKHSSAIVAHVASHRCCRFVDCAWYDMNLPFHCIPKGLCWIEIWWLLRSFKYIEPMTTFKKPVWDDLRFVAWAHFPVGNGYTVVINGWTSEPQLLQQYYN